MCVYVPSDTSANDEIFLNNDKLVFGMSLFWHFTFSYHKIKVCHENDIKIFFFHVFLSFFNKLYQLKVTNHILS